MQYLMISKSEAPPVGPERRKRRLPEIESLVAELAPGTVAKVILAENEKPRPIVEHLYRSAARQGKIVDVWEAGGFLFVELVDINGD